MKKQIFTLILILFVNFLQAQNPLVKQWDYRFGGLGAEALFSFQKTFDGGYILGGWSASNIGGDKTQPSWGSWDYWIVKTDSLGNKQWDKDFGGTSYDELYDLKQTADGGYILGGRSKSGIGGDKAQANWDTTGNTWDYWIVKTDSIGTKLWDRTFGGTNNDYLFSLQQTTDGGYLIGGYSNSGITGDKTQVTWGGSVDFWIVKTDSLGNKQWDKDFGGTSDDNLISLMQTKDGGYILGGGSWSGINGDKTQASWGQSDFWMVKIDSLGVKQWDKDFGGTSDEAIYSLQQTNDRGFILGGYSLSGISGDKTQALWGGILSDYWIVKTDSLGNKQWDKDFGGTNSEDEFGNITQTSDGGYLIAGTSYSDSSGNKTENNLGDEQSWILKIDSLGNKQWDKTLLTDVMGDDEIGFGYETKNGCYIMANSTDGGIGGDKTQPSWGGFDYWIIKFCDSTFATASANFQIPFTGLQISPNPFASEISISIQKTSMKQVSFSIKNIFGQIVFIEQKNNLGSSYTKTIGVNFLSKGIYLLDVIIDGERTVKKIVKE